MRQREQTSSIWDIAWRLGFTGIGRGIFQAPNTRALMGAAPRSAQGEASGLLATGRVIGQSLSVAIKEGDACAGYFPRKSPEIEGDARKIHFHPLLCLAEASRLGHPFRSSSIQHKVLFSCALARYKTQVHP